MKRRNGNGVAPGRRRRFTCFRRGADRLHRLWPVLLLCFSLPAVAGDAKPPFDHSVFEALKGPFAGPEDVNSACLSCHNISAGQLHATRHWSWRGEDGSDGRPLGKLQVMNNFHPSVVSNLPDCVQCHIGFGLERQATTLPQQAAVDCLVCHDRTGDYAYKKFHQDGAKCLVCHDDGAERLKQEAERTEPPARADWAEIARKAGPTGRASCGACHFRDGGADGAKHGDLNSLLINSSRSLDVHMAADGADFSCAACHSAVNHDLADNRRPWRLHTPGLTGAGDSATDCRSCHGPRPMKNEKLNDHTDRVACQTCHIPLYARGGVATKTAWDWETAGKRNRKREPMARYDDAGRVLYSSWKGDITWGENLQPDYMWLDGTVAFARPGDPLAAEGATPINSYGGAADNPAARIFPVRRFHARLPVDGGNATLAAPFLSGADRAAYWFGYNWRRSLEVGQDAAGLEFSGTVGFADTVMTQPLNHMVAPKEMSLDCVECHARDGRLQGIEGVYIPGRDAPRWLDILGVTMILGVGGGCLLHGCARAAFAIRRKRRSKR